MNSYIFLILLCLILILSFWFSTFSKKTNIPSVIFLLSIGMIGKYILGYWGITLKDYFFLEIIGILGLIFIVLEAALDLSLSKDKKTIISKAFLVALAGFIINVIILTSILFIYIEDVTFYQAVLYATPLSIISSAIVIPSIKGLSSSKQEFLIYESTFSDIIGIMFFYLWIENANASSFSKIIGSVSLNLTATIIASILVSFILLYIFQKFVNHQTRFAVFIAMLVMLYSVAKLIHLSSLLIILIFGLILRNHHLFIKGKLERYYNGKAIDSLFENFMMITEEGSFVVRSIFFVLFGFSISMGDLLFTPALFVSGLFLAFVFLSRFLIFEMVIQKDIHPEIYIAPRGLISILLFTVIPDEFKAPTISQDILFLTIMATSIIMGVSMVSYGKKEKKT